MRGAANSKIYDVDKDQVKMNCDERGCNPLSADN